MKTKLSLLLIASFLLASCSTATPEPTATPVDIPALQTAAVSTVIADLTVNAPTLTPSPLPTDTLTPAPTDTPAPTSAPTVALCDDSEFVADVSVPDGTEMTAGQEFVKTWRMKNTGSCTWTTGYTVVFAYGERMGYQTISLPSEVLAGQEIEISVNLKAPATAGTYQGFFRMVNNNGYGFGKIMTVVIVVK